MNLDFVAILVITFVILGHTGRKDNCGTSYTLFTPSNAPKARDLSVLIQAKQVVNPKLQGQELPNRGSYGGRSQYGGDGGGYGGRLRYRNRFTFVLYFALYC